MPGPQPMPPSERPAPNEDLPGQEIPSPAETPDVPGQEIPPMPGGPAPGPDIPSPTPMG